MSRTSGQRGAKGHPPAGRSKSNAPRPRLSADGSTVVAVNTGTIATNAWQFIAGRFLPSAELATFVNNTKDSLAAGIPASIANTTAPFEIGRYNAANPYSGKAAGCFLCASALPDYVLTAIYEQSRALYGV